MAVRHQNLSKKVVLTKTARRLFQTINCQNGWWWFFFWRGMSIWSFIQKKFQGLANISCYFFCNSVQTQFEWLEWVRLKRLKRDVKMSNIWKVLGSRYNHNWHYDVVVLGFCTQKPPHISIMQYLPILVLFLFLQNGVQCTGRAAQILGDFCLKLHYWVWPKLWLHTIFGSLGHHFTTTRELRSRAILKLI